MAYEQRALSKTKLATKIIGIQEKETAKTAIFKLLQQEQSAEQMKSLKVEKETPKAKKFCSFQPFIEKR